MSGNQEEPEQKKSAMKATIESVLASSNQSVEVQIDGQIFEIRPLTWRMERDITAAVEGLISRGIPKSVANREYVKIAIHQCLVEPKLDEPAIEKMRLGTSQKLFDEIAELSSGDKKKVLMPS